MNNKVIVNKDIMQKLADALNKIGNKYHPDNQWVLLGGKSDIARDLPGIRLIGKDGNTHKGVDRETADKITEALYFSGLYYDNFEDSRKDCYPLEIDTRATYSDTGLDVLRIEPSDSTLSLKDIEEIAANYDTLMETMFNKQVTTAVKAMQVLANTLNKIEAKYHPDNRWVVMGGSVDNPGIRLIGKDGNTHKGVDKATAGKIQKALSLSGLYNDLYGDDTVSREDCYPLEIDEKATYLDTGLTVLRISPTGKFNFGSMRKTIKNIGASYEKHMEEEFGNKANTADNTMQNLADTLNRVGGKYHPDHEWKVIGEGIRLINKNGDAYDGVDRDTFHDVEKALFLAGMYSEQRAGVQQGIRRGDWSGSFEIGTHSSKAGTIVAEINVIPGKAPSPQEVAKLGVNYYKQLQKVAKKAPAPVSKRVADKLKDAKKQLENSTIVKKLHNAISK